MPSKGERAFGNVIDILLFYAKGHEYTFHSQHADYSPEYLKKYSYVDADGGDTGSIT